MGDGSTVEVFIPDKDVCIFVAWKDVRTLQNTPEEFNYLRKSHIDDNTPKIPTKKVQLQVDSTILILFLIYIIEAKVDTCRRINLANIVLDLLEVAGPQPLRILYSNEYSL